MTECVDVGVAGGGPAGAATALGLARLGYRVVLFHTADGEPGRLECLPSSLWPVLDALGLRPRISDAGFTPCTLTRVRWSLPREESRHDPGGLLVRRTRFDTVLLAAACDAGVRLAACRKPVRPVREGSGWRLAGTRARLLIDAAGRPGVLSGGRQRLLPSLVALTGDWSGPPASQASMVVEGLRHGWCWAATEGGGMWHVSLFLDVATSAGLGRAGRTAAYHAMVAESSRLAGLRPVEAPVRLCDASAWSAERVATVEALKVGDAALARDPLSSQGVPAALRTALGAVATAHAILSGTDTEAEAAVTRYAAACRDSADQHLAAAGTLYAAGAWRASAFWHRRSGLGPQAATQPERDDRGGFHYKSPT